jgi:TDG/mug DNA glycosylase family protein
VPRFTRADLDAFRGAVVPDLVGADLRLLFVGINPGLWTAAVQTHFAHPGNRFYPALLEAGIVDRRIDPAAGMTDEDRDYFVGRGLGITNLVARASARADELSTAELREGGGLLVERVATWRPTVVAILGITAYRAAFGARKAVPGRQAEPIGSAQLWVVPNPSGLNAHDTVATLATAYRAAAEAAGVVSPSSTPT